MSWKAPTDYGDLWLFADKSEQSWKNRDECFSCPSKKGGWRGKAAGWKFVSHQSISFFCRFALLCLSMCIHRQILITSNPSPRLFSLYTLKTFKSESHFSPHSCLPLSSCLFVPVQSNSSWHSQLHWLWTCISFYVYNYKIDQWNLVRRCCNKYPSKHIIHNWNLHFFWKIQWTGWYFFSFQYKSKVKGFHITPYLCQ